MELTHWGRVMHIGVGKLTIIGSDNGLLPVQCQAIIWTNAGILLIGPLGTNFSEILIGIQTFQFKKMHLKMMSSKWWPFCLSLNVLQHDTKHSEFNTINDEIFQVASLFSELTQTKNTNIYFNIWEYQCVNIFIWSKPFLNTILCIFK